jgi:elongation factor Ts
VTATAFTAKDVQALRQQTGAGMMDCKKALTEAEGDMDRALELLKVQMGKKLGKLASRETAEGTIQTYVHATGKIAAMVQVECNTDFVARNEDFIAFAKDVALHVAAANPRYVSADEISQEDKDREIRVWDQQLEAEGKPENIRPKIIEGKLKAWGKEVALLDQPHVNAEKYEGKTIEQIRGDVSASTGENIVIKRFARFAIGE